MTRRQRGLSDSVNLGSNPRSIPLAEFSRVPPGTRFVISINPTFGNRHPLEIVTTLRGLTGRMCHEQSHRGELSCLLCRQTCCTSVCRGAQYLTYGRTDFVLCR